MQDFSWEYQFEASPEKVFEGVRNVRGWWSALLIGESRNLGDVFSYQHKQFHHSVQKLVEVVPNELMVWEVTESSLSFIAKQDEWTGSTIRFEVERAGVGAKLKFQHLGLNTNLECFGACSQGWTHYLENSLVPLIETGEGQPDKE